MTISKQQFVRAATGAALGALAMGLGGCGTVGGMQSTPISENPRVIMGGQEQTTNQTVNDLQSPDAVTPSGVPTVGARVDYSAPSPAYYNRGSGNQVGLNQNGASNYRGPAYPRVAPEREFYYQQWGFKQLRGPDGSMRNYEGCWKVQRQQYLDTDGVYKNRDVATSLVQKNKALCTITNPLSPLVSKLPSAPPGARGYGPPKYNY